MSDDAHETIQLRMSHSMRTFVWCMVAVFVGCAGASLFGTVAIPAGLIDDGEDYSTLTLVALSAGCLAFAVLFAYAAAMLGRMVRRSTTCNREGIVGLYFQQKSSTGRVQWWRDSRYSRDLVPWADVANVRCVSKANGEGSAWVAVVYLQDGTEAETAGRSPFRKRTDGQVQAVAALRARSLSYEG